MNFYKSRKFIIYIALIFVIPTIPLFYTAVHYFKEYKQKIEFIKSEISGTSELTVYLLDIARGGENTGTLARKITELGDSSNLILDSALETYYLMEILIIKWPEILKLLAEEDQSLIDWRSIRKVTLDVVGSLNKSNLFYSKSVQDADFFMVSSALKQMFDAIEEKNVLKLKTLMWQYGDQINTQLYKMLSSRKRVFEREFLFEFTSSVFLLFITMFISAYLIYITLKEQRNYISTISEQQNTIEKKSRLELSGELFASIAHDIMTPISIIELSSYKISLLTKGSSDGNVDIEKIQLANAKIFKWCKQIANIVKNMKSLLKNTDDVKPEIVNIKSFVDDIKELAELRINKSKVTFEVSYLTEHQFFEINYPAVSQIIVNLINNSCDALLDSEMRLIKLSIEYSNDNLIFTIEDSGPGIPENIRSKVFDSLFTTKVNTGGTGLGLTISKSLALRLKGDLTLANSEKGAKFLLKIPSKLVSNVIKAA